MSIKKHHRADEDEGTAAAPDAEPAMKKARTEADGADKSAQDLKSKQERKAKKEKKKLEKKERKAAQEAAKQAEDPAEKKAHKEHKSGTKEEKDKKRQEKKEKKEKKKAEKKMEKKTKKAAESDSESEAFDAEAAEAPAEAASTAKTTTNGASNGDAEAAATVSGNYTQTAALTAVPEADVQAFLAKEQVAVYDPRAKEAKTQLRPIMDFGQLPATALMAQKPFAGFTAPTPIQAASWPYTLGGRDLVGIAETGSGKTLAFALPCVEALSGLARPAAVAAGKALPKRSRLHGGQKWEAAEGGGRMAQARAVIVSPTRELAMQTHAAVEPLARRAGLTTVCLYGGASKDEQRVRLRHADGVDIVVATPGRLKDFLADEAVSLAHVRFAVLDEADRMLDTGFEEDIRHILGQCPDKAQRQTLMFTATWPTSVRGLADGFMVDPVKITVGSRTRAGAIDGGDGAADGSDPSRARANTGAVELQANARIVQTVEVLDQREKERRLLTIIKQEQRGKARNDRILVFCLYKKEAVRVENWLQGQGVRVCSIHGNLRQEQRTQSLEAFKSGSTPVLVATDVAARGLDIPEVKLVINVTFPLTIEDYVHRIGRTGRAGKAGRAITFFTEHDKAHSGSLINVLKGANQEVPEELFKFGTTIKKKAHGDYGVFFKDVDMSQKGTKITFD